MAPLGHAHHAHDHDHHDHHDHGHDHDHHDHGHDHDHHRDGHDHHAHHGHHHDTWTSRLWHWLPFSHSHAAEDKVDTALESSARGIWALKVSLVGLAATAFFQLAIVLLSGSTALFADTVHNFSDALTALPLWLAFALSRRAATRRYTYGYGRAEDLAVAAIVLMILASALLAGYESYRR
ncbi:MAG: cation transporter, partial [Chloroflexales bacterium]|nr:cation transporter [Chloroflexales bacterium]